MRRTFTLLLALLIPLALLAHEGHDALPTKGVTVKGDTVTLTVEAKNALGLRTVDVETDSIARSVLAQAAVELAPDAHAFATSQLGGRVEKVLVEPGQTVRAGETLALLHSPELETLLLDAETAELERRLAQAEVTRLEELARQGVRNPRELLAAQNRVQERANAQLVARLKLHALGARVGQGLPVRAPVAGVIAMTDASPGAVVEPEQHLFDIVDSTRLRVRVEVPEAYAPQIALGQSAEVQLRAAGNSAGPLMGTVAARANRIEPRSLSESVWLTFPQGPESLRAGLAGVARISIERRDKVLLVPDQAVIRDGIETYVFVQTRPATKTQAGVYDRKHVTLGLSQAGRTEIKSGLLSIDPVVVTGQRQLATLFVQGVLRPSATARRNVELKVGPLTRHPIATVVELDAELDLPPGGRAVVAAPFTAKVVQVGITQPQRVQANERLIELSSLHFQNLQLDLIQAELARRLHQGTLDRYGSEAGRDAIPAQLRQEAETNLAIANKRVESFSRRLEALGLDARRIDEIRAQQSVLPTFWLHASKECEVLPTGLSVGQVLKEGTLLFTLQDRGQLWAHGRVAGQDLLRVQAGQTARLRLAALPGFLATSKVARVEAFSHKETRFASVWVQVANPGGLLRANQLGRLAIEVDSPVESLALPLQAIWREGSEWYAFTHERQRDVFLPRKLDLGQRDDCYVQVRRGLQEGDAVALSAVTDLRRGFGRIK